MSKSTQYAIATIPNYYMPDIQGNNAEAQSAIDELEDETYCLSHGEAGRPEYVIVDDCVADYIDGGRNSDGSNYDWDDNDCDKNNGDCCGECQQCIEMMIDQDREYVKANAVTE